MVSSLFFLGEKKAGEKKDKWLQTQYTSFGLKFLAAMYPRSAKGIFTKFNHHPNKAKTREVSCGTHTEARDDHSPPFTITDCLLPNPYPLELQKKLEGKKKKKKKWKNKKKRKAHNHIQQRKHQDYTPNPHQTVVVSAVNLQKRMTRRAPWREGERNTTEDPKRTVKQRHTVYIHIYIRVCVSRDARPKIHKLREPGTARVESSAGLSMPPSRYESR